MPADHGIFNTASEGGGFDAGEWAVTLDREAEMLRLLDELAEASR